jgi:hypothetical protein
MVRTEGELEPGLPEGVPPIGLPDEAQHRRGIAVDGFPHLPPGPFGEIHD